MVAGTIPQNTENKIYKIKREIIYLPATSHKDLITFMLFNYLTKKMRSKDTTSPLEEYEMKRKEKGLFLYIFGVLHLGSHSCYEKSFHEATRFNSHRFLEGFLETVASWLDFSNTCILSNAV